MFSISKHDKKKSETATAIHAFKPANDLIEHYHKIRQDSIDLCIPLKIEDYVIQTAPEVSPPKWHLAHQSWFFENFLLKPYLNGYREFNSHFNNLFNSYYNTLGTYHPREQRGLLSRPTVKEVLNYRNYVDASMLTLLSEYNADMPAEIFRRTVLGLNHEQQHQELLLTDIKHIFAHNPLHPVYKIQATVSDTANIDKQMNWVKFPGGMIEIGHSGNNFAFDNEEPKHLTYIHPFKFSSRLVTNGEYIEFINDHGYQRPDLWLADAWNIVKSEKWKSPLYWEYHKKTWWHMTLSGMQKVNLDTPVCHVSFYEANAYARWAKKRLPTEQEWEHVAGQKFLNGNLRDSGNFEPIPLSTNEKINQLFGDVWEWTQSPYVPYPGYQQIDGAFGEYNGKFMSGQMILRGGSCATANDHIRASYRNFFYPHERWQFCGIRLTQDVL